MTCNSCRVLFFAEGATLAHVARPSLLAKNLDPTRFDVFLARPGTFGWLTADAVFAVVELDCQGSDTFSRRLDHGQPLYDLATLERYVQADLALIDDLKPDVVVGDFRLSLSVSARLRQVPYISICDAYWSPERPLEPILPVLGITRHVPIPLAERVFQAVAPIAFRFHARPMERLRRRHGLPPLCHDLRHCYTDADLRLFANFPALFPEVQRTSTADFIGPISWSPAERCDLEFPSGDGPLVYVTMGSSGDPRILANVIPVLEEAGTRVMVATAGKKPQLGSASARTRIYDFLPGDQMCRLAQLVVCNGGSPTTNQALARGVPVLGIARNMDQFLNMRSIEQFGAGLTVRSDRADRVNLGQLVDRLLHDDRFADRARRLAQSAPAGGILERHIEALASASRHASAI